VLVELLSYDVKDHLRGTTVSIQFDDLQSVVGAE
jgi:hypothetical protein